MTRNAYSDAEMERGVDQIVVEHSTLPAAELFYAARIGGELDLEAPIAGRPQIVLFRVGNAVSYLFAQGS